MHSFFFCLLILSRAAPAAYGGSQARGRIGAVGTGLRQSHSNVGSEPHLQPTPQLTATPDPSPTEQGQGLSLCPHGCLLVRFVSPEPGGELPRLVLIKWIILPGLI